MIVNDRITDYIRSLESSQGSLLDSIEQEAERERVPIIRRETAALLRTLVAALRPARILEIGTAVGYSSLLMCRVMPENCRITTIEKYEKRIPAAREHFKMAGEEGRITLLEGDADDLLAGLRGQTFDLVFMDAAKGQYLHWLPMILELMPEGGGGPHIGQCTSGRRYRGIQICSGAQEQDHPQQDAPVSLRA